MRRDSPPASPIRLVFLLVLLALLELVLATGCSEAPPAALGTLEWDRVDGRAIVSEPIVEVFVREGDRVVAGAPLLRLDTRLQEAQVAQSRAAVVQAEWKLTERKQGFRDEEVAKARAELEAAKVGRETAKRQLDREENLEKADVVSTRQLDAYRDRLAQSEAREAAAQKQLELLTEGFRTEEIEQAQAQLEASQAELAYQQAQLDRYTVTAQRAGLVDALPFKVGDKPPAQAVVTTVLAGDQPWARVYLPETWLGQIAVGDSVEVHVDGRPRAFAGRVRHIESEASFTPYYALAEQDRARLSYVTEVDLLDAAARDLRVGIPVRMTPAAAD